MKIAVIGAGAMGSLFAWHLASAGKEVWAFDVREDHIEAIRRSGLTALHAGEAHTVAVNATTDPSEVGIVDVALVLVKFGQTRAAVEAAQPMVGPRTLILTLQNGIGNVDVIAEVCAGNRIVFGLTTLTSELLGPGRIDASYRGKGETCLWPRDGNVDLEVDAICTALNEGGISASVAADIEVRIWKKLIVNCCLNTMCAITGLTVGRLVDNPGIWPVLDGLAGEVVEAAQATGITLVHEDARAFLRSVAEQARNHEPSMLIDVRHRRATEIDCLNGAVLAICDRNGLAAPLNRALYAIIRAIEMSWNTGS